MTIAPHGIIFNVGPRIDILDNRTFLKELFGQVDSRYLFIEDKTTKIFYPVKFVCSSPDSFFSSHSNLYIPHPPKALRIKADLLHGKIPVASHTDYDFPADTSDNSTAYCSLSDRIYLPGWLTTPSTFKESLQFFSFYYAYSKLIYPEDSIIENTLPNDHTERAIKI